MADEPEAGDDIGWWDCSLCTYKNSADKFKCEICDLRRGTSTRKPRCNADTIVAQVVKQQEQIRQQTRAKPAAPRTSRNSTSIASSHAPTTSSENLSTDKLPNSPRSPRARERSSSVSSETTDYSSSHSSSPEPGKSSPNHVSVENNDKSNNNERTSSTVPIEIDGKIIKYAPPTCTGRTGLIIDKKRFTQHSVTVNDVTITFTEFATRQNKYIRKKKKRRDRSLPSSKH